MNEYIAEYGQKNKVEILLSDNGAQFTSGAWRLHWADRGISLRTTSPYTPSSNPVERVIGTIRERIRIFSGHNQRRWANLVRDIELSINAVEHGTTKAIPSLLMGKAAELDKACQMFKSIHDKNVLGQIKEATATTETPNPNLIPFLSPVLLMLLLLKIVKT